MAEKIHRFEVQVCWTGNLGRGTETYRAYSREHYVTAPGKATTVPASSDPAFRGDATRYSPEELFVASLSSCHMLWVLHLCADAGIVVTAYSDHAGGTMVVEPDGSGRFTEVVLRPRMTITDANRIGDVAALHNDAHRLCFIANSVSCAVRHEPEVTAG